MLNSLKYQFPVILYLPSLRWSLQFFYGKIQTRSQHAFILPGATILLVDIDKKKKTKKIHVKVFIYDI